MEREWTASKPPTITCVCPNPLYSNALHLLVNVSQRLMFALESGGRVMSYLDETLKKALLYIKRLFDKLIVSLQYSLCIS